MNNENKRITFYIVFIFLLVAVTVLLLEIILRFLPYFLEEPQKGLFDEARRITFSNTRVYPEKQVGGPAIKLPDQSSSGILVIGDSFPFGWLVDEKNIFPEILKEKLKRPVVNLAVATGGLVEYNRMLEVGMRYNPKLIIYCFFANDLEDIVIPVEIKKLSIDNSRKELEGDRAWYVDKLDWWDSYNHYRKTITNLSLGFQLFKKFYYYGEHVSKHKTLFWKTNEYSFLFTKTSYWSGISWESKNVQKKSKIVVDLIKEASRFSKLQNAEFIVVFQPTRAMVYGPLITSNSVQDEVFDPNHHLTYQKIQEMLDDSSVKWLDLTEDLQNQAKKGVKLYFTIDGHFNDQGHLAVAKFLERYIKDQYP